MHPLIGPSRGSNGGGKGGDLERRRKGRSQKNMRKKKGTGKKENMNSRKVNERKISRGGSGKGRNQYTGLPRKKMDKKD